METIVPNRPGCGVDPSCLPFSLERGIVCPSLLSAACSETPQCRCYNAAMNKERSTLAVHPEDVLSASEYQVLMRAQRGELTCPRCGSKLLGRFFFRVKLGDQIKGVQLNCVACGFEEY